MMDVLSGFGGFGVPLLAFAGLVVLAILVIFIGRRARRHRGHGLVAGHRLAVVDQVTIDDHRRLVLIQRDDVQHLVILGGGSDFLVESGIGAAQLRPTVEEPRRAAHETVAAPAPTPAARRPAPQPAPAAPPGAEPRAPDPRAPEARPYEPPVRPHEPPARPIPAPLAARRPSAPAGPADEPVAVLPPVPLRAEPVVEPASPAPAAEPGPRTAVKIDPAFAGMAEELEEVLRRPAADLPPRRTPASLASAPINPAAERPVPPVAPPAPPSRGPAAAEPVNAPTAPAAPPPVAPEPRIIPTRGEAAPEIRAPEVRTTEPLAEAPEVDKVSDDPFEQEMANLLGRAKRP